MTAVDPLAVSASEATAGYHGRVEQFEQADARRVDAGMHHPLLAQRVGRAASTTHIAFDLEQPIALASGKRAHERRVDPRLRVEAPLEGVDSTRETGGESPRMRRGLRR